MGRRGVFFCPEASSSGEVAATPAWRAHQNGCSWQELVGEQYSNGISIVLLKVNITMDSDRQKEEFSNAFIQAVSASAGFSATKPSVDDDSVDWTIAQAGGGGTIRSPSLDVQLKSSATIDLEDDADTFAYPLKIKNYHELRHTDFLVPRILVVARLPADVQRWTEQSDESLLLRHCAYWISLRGRPDSSNTTSITVHLSVSQRFTVESLQDMMLRISKGDHP